MGTRRLRRAFVLVSMIVSPAHALLVLCTITKSRAKNIAAEGRAKLVQYLKQNDASLLCPTFQNKAIELGFCHDMNYMVLLL